MPAGQSLHGKKILVSRPAQQCAQLSQLLAAELAEPIELPLIRICAPDSWSEFDNAFKSFDTYSWLIFASANAVEHTVSRLKEIGLFELIAKIQIACMGANTARKLSEYGLSPAIVPNEFIAEALIEQFPTATKERKRVLWPRTNIGRNTLIKGLEKKGWDVDIVPCYKTEGPENPAAAAEILKALLESKQLYAITLASSETCKRLKEILALAGAVEPEAQTALLGAAKLAVIGPETARTCLQLFGRVDIEASEHTSAGLVEAIKRA